jgi:nucleoside-diphosphate-sugar epimerase
MSNKEKVLITGASGFVGKSLLHQFDFDRYDVSILTRSPKKFDGETRFQVVKGDLLDLLSLKRAVSGVSVLINLAAEVRNQDKLEAINVGGTKNLLQAIQEEPSLKTLIHLSSVGVVGMNFSLDSLVVDEQFPPAPKNEYERTKLISEQLFVDYLRQSTLSWSILRPTNVFGPHHPFDALLNLMKYVQEGKQVLLTPGSQVNYVYVDDLSACILNQLNASGNAVLNVGYSMNLKAFVNHIAHELAVPAKITGIPKWVVRLCRALKIRKLDSVSNEVIYSDKRLRSFFEYPVGIEEGIKRTVLYYKKLNKL